MAQAYKKAGNDNQGKQMYRLIDDDHIVEEFSIQDIDDQIARTQKELDRLNALKSTLSKV